MRQSSFMLFDQEMGTATTELTDCHQFAWARIAVTGDFMGSVRFVGSIDGEELFPVEGVNSKTGLGQTATTMRGLFELNCRGLNSIGCELADWTSGAVSVRGTLSE